MKRGKHYLSVIVTLGGALLLAGGCARHSADPALTGLATPRDGEKISAEIWKVKPAPTPALKPAKDANAGKKQETKAPKGDEAKHQEPPIKSRLEDFFSTPGDARRADQTRWALPFVESVREFTLDSGKRRAAAAHDVWVDAGEPLASLPLYVSRNQHFYKEGSEAPVGERRILWTPLWASARQTGDLDSSLTVHGVPLLWSDLHAHKPTKSQDLTVNLYSTLWTLGPAACSFDNKEAKERQRGFLFTPFLLGGAKGVALWCDYHVVIEESPNKQGEPSRMAATGHGPLLGILGYVSMRRSATDASDEPSIVRIVLLGAGWLDMVNQKKGQSLHGPLWGMVGWGRTHGRPAVTVFWNKVPIPFTKAADATPAPEEAPKATTIAAR